VVGAGPPQYERVGGGGKGGEGGRGGGDTPARALSTQPSDREDTPPQPTYATPSSPPLCPPLPLPSLRPFRASARLLAYEQVF